MASVCGRVANRGMKSTVLIINGNGNRHGLNLLHRSPSPPPSSSSFSAAAPLRSRRFFLSRCPVELGSVESLMPLHSAVAAARMTACLSTTSLSCRSHSQDGIDGT